MKAAALRGALSERARNGRVHVVSGFTGSDLPKTKDAVELLTAVTGTRRGNGALVVLHRDDELGWKSLRNVPGVHVLHEDQLNTYDVLASDHVVFTEQALTAFLTRTRKTGSAGQDSVETSSAQTELSGDKEAQA
jgi:large subunit ribosomal protein L4